MTTLSLAMIVRNEATTIERVLGAARQFCDELIVVDTGSEDDTVRIATAMGATVHTFPWIDDFAAARQFSFSKCSGDWIMWLDGDDVVREADRVQLQQLKEQGFQDDCDAVYMQYAAAPFLFWRERLVRRSAFEATMRWIEPVHEYIDGIDPARAVFRDDIRIHHDTPPERAESKTGRNIGIIRRRFARGARDERTLHTYATECLHLRLRDEAEPVLALFFEGVRSRGYRYQVLCRMYDFFMHFGEPDRAAEAAGRAIAEDPGRAEAYIRLGRHTADHLDRPEAAIALFTLAGSLPVPVRGVYETGAYSHEPLAGMCRAYFRLGDLEGTRRLAAEAIRAGSPDYRFLLKVVELEGSQPVRVPVPAEWQDWVASNIANRAQRATVVRTLEQHGFAPDQIVSVMPDHFRSGDTSVPGPVDAP